MRQAISHLINHLETLIDLKTILQEDNARLDIVVEKMGMHYNMILGFSQGPY